LGVLKSPGSNPPNSLSRSETRTSTCLSKMGSPRPPSPAEAIPALQNPCFVKGATASATCEEERVYCKFHRGTQHPRLAGQGTAIARSAQAQCFRVLSPRPSRGLCWEGGGEGETEVAHALCSSRDSAEAGGIRFQPRGRSSPRGGEGRRGEEERARAQWCAAASRVPGSVPLSRSCAALAPCRPRAPNPREPRLLTGVPRAQPAVARDLARRGPGGWAEL
jgi:hypothetical protein